MKTAAGKKNGRPQLGCYAPLARVPAPARDKPLVGRWAGPKPLLGSCFCWKKKNGETGLLSPLGWAGDGLLLDRNTVRNGKGTG